MEILIWIIGIYLLMINFLSFFLFGIDKFKAAIKRRRISEKNLLISVGIGGFLGGILGMIFFSHKTIKSSFQIYFWLLVFVWIIISIIGLIIFQNLMIG